MVTEDNYKINNPWAGINHKEILFAPYLGQPILQKKNPATIKRPDGV
jgi:hypothetical protein